MAKKKETRIIKKPYTLTPNRGSLQVRIRPEYVAALGLEVGDQVKQMVFDPDQHEPRIGDLIIRKVTVLE